ncbi:hypothetical protein M406DRAFT_357480 [Cryphonectria parasitica EP155]|uniref:DUF1275 domain protein n=1 Tax=Cryphonectria parasitica (strain ATCC 38755 / EP155) TaxID=660469 RepID=A0A9P4XWB8_CRYP1|nr:uncharacterized protein M406DRAFT_357480 [Cryphonectria parasitica EP155]KAF3762502.1 hypothetical protein M406DRAFT_357480 [Cryphonectria parasitica EP155]
MEFSAAEAEEGSRSGGRREEQQETDRSSLSALPRTPPPRHSLLWRGKDHLLQHVRPSTLAEVELLLLTFCTGLQDAISFPDYHCFASNQTGNTIFLAVAIIVPKLNGDTFFTANIAVALGLFLAGGYLTGQLSHVVGPRLRIWLILCNFVQTLLVFAAAAIKRHTGIQATGPLSLLVISLLAFASGSQVVQSRSLRMTEISTAMATAAWVDLVIDPHLMAVRQKNRPRNRRLAFMVSLFAGTLLGAAIYRMVGSDVAIFVSGGGKAVVTGMYFLNGAEERSNKEEDDDKVAV